MVCVAAGLSVEVELMEMRPEVELAEMEPVEVELENI